MAKLHLTVWCEASYETEIEVPDGLSREEAFEYAKEHLDEVPLGELEYLPDSDNLDDADLDFPERVFLEEDEAADILGLNIQCECPTDDESDIPSFLRCGEPIRLKDDALWASIVSYMDDDIRELVHNRGYASYEAFLYAYMDEDAKFETLLKEEFGITTLF